MPGRARRWVVSWTAALFYVQCFYHYTSCAAKVNPWLQARDGCCKVQHEISANACSPRLGGVLCIWERLSCRDRAQSTASRCLSSDQRRKATRGYIRSCASNRGR